MTTIRISFRNWIKGHKKKEKSDAHLSQFVRQAQLLEVEAYSDIFRDQSA